jgi:hypothetical protein
MLKEALGVLIAKKKMMTLMVTDRELVVKLSDK